MAIDQADQSIITRALVAATHEMGSKLIRSAHSPIVREAQDCSAALLDSTGRVIAQAELTAIQLGSITHTFSHCLELFPVKNLKSGDFIINNDPYNGGQHLPDIFIFTPIFYQGQILGFSASVVHHIDLGGGAPGLNPDATDIHQEGIVFPPSLYNITRDWHGGTLERFIAANVRMPEATIGDINAQFAANLIGAKRLLRLAERYGVDSLNEAMAATLDYSERRVRAAIKALPNGVYHGKAQLDDDGINEKPVIIRTQVCVDGENIHITFNETATQVATNLNCPFASTYASALACTKSVLTSPDIPFNDGVSRVISVEAPYGSVLNPKPPAPVRARLLASNRVFNAVMKALANVVPQQVIAEGYDTTTPVCLSHLDENGYNIYLEILGGGYGAGSANDGCDGIDCPLSNCANIPIEALEMDYPFLRIENYSLRENSGGTGKQRGGHGFERSYQILSSAVIFATYGDRFKTPAEGIFGGQNGACAEIIVERQDTVIQLNSKTAFNLNEGDILRIRTGGGGGYGLFEERLNSLISHDQATGLTSP